MNLNNLTKAAIFSAMGIGIGYAFMLVPNVEFLTFTVFLAGLTLGFRWGVVIGFVTEFTFSALNPIGSGLMFPHLIILQSVGITLVGAAGGIFRSRFVNVKWSKARQVQVGILGFVLTFIFDLLTTLSFPIASGFDWSQSVGVILSGLGFAIVHQLSNAGIFAFGTQRMLEVIQK